MVHIQIDGKPIRAAEGRTLLEACRENGIEIPTLCYHPALEPFGACRLCMVEVSIPPRPPKLAAACVTPCEEGQVVSTQSETVQAVRRVNAELLLAGASNNPELLNLAKMLGVSQVRFQLPQDEPCILCGLCVRACREIVGVGAISLINRGMNKKVSPPFQKNAATCIGCGTCVLICPTGAIHLDEVTGIRSVHPVETEYDQVDCQICSDVELRVH